MKTALDQMNVGVYLYFDGISFAKPEDPKIYYKQQSSWDRDQRARWNLLNEFVLHWPQIQKQNFIQIMHHTPKFTLQICSLNEIRYRIFDEFKQLSGMLCSWCFYFFHLHLIIECRHTDNLVLHYLEYRPPPLFTYTPKKYQGVDK
ncbi:Hypothetical_protein [Hexamita inflata]|uniref:Hypothetical_protein n=1 Tax=Hexamita inflata TaxID=28002 RepID=A0ABP1IT75_9EUKA